MLNLLWAKGSIPTPYGDVSVNWKRYDNQFEISVSLPSGVSGKIKLPDGSCQHVATGNKTVIYTFHCEINATDEPREKYL